MKTKLFTKKTYLGVLMTLVLVFSVQGIADALTFSTSRSGDLETKAPNEKFTVTFSVSLKGNTAIRNTDGDLVTEGGQTIDSSGYQIDSDGNRLNTAADGTVGSIPIDSSGFELDSAKKRVTVHIDKDGDNVVDSGETYYTLVKKDTNKVTVDSSRYEVNSSTGARTGTSPTPGAKQFKVSDAVRYHYNSEAIGIDLEGPATITKVGSLVHSISDTTDNQPDFKMYEPSHASYNTAAAHEKLSGSVTLTLEPTTAQGKVTIKVTDETPTTDAPTNGKSDPITFTLYVVNYQGAIDDNVTTLVGDSVDYAFHNDVRPLANYFTFAGTNVPVHYSIEGSGSFSIQETYTDDSPDSVKTFNKTVSTSNLAPVFIDMKQSTNKVTVHVSGGGSKTMIFIYQGTTPTKYPKIRITGGNNQTGAIQARLEEPFTVKVTDGNNRPLSGLTVGFTTLSGTNSLFIPVPGTRVYGSGTTLTTTAPTTNLVDNSDNTTTATGNKPNAGTSIFVQTDRNGVAQTYYRLGNNTGSYQVTPNLEGIASGSEPQPRDPRVFDATAVSGSRSASLVIVSGNNQRSDTNTHDVAKPLVVRVRRPGGYRISNVIIRFTALTGVLEASTGTKYVANDDVTALPSARAGYTPTGVTATDNAAIHGSVSGQEIFVLTNAHGEAAAVYNAGQISGAKTVTGRVDDEEAVSQYDFQIRQVVFNIDGTGSTTTPPTTTQPTTPTTPRLSISVTGEGTTRTVTVNASDGRRVLATLGGTALAASPTTPSTPGTTGTVYQVGDSIPRAAGILGGGATFNISGGGSLRLNDRVYTCINPPCQIRDYVVTQGTPLYRGDSPQQHGDSHHWHAHNDYGAEHTRHVYTASRCY